MTTGDLHTLRDRDPEVRWRFDETALLDEIERATSVEQLVKIARIARARPASWVAFLRHVPVQHWQATTVEFHPLTTAMGLARSIDDPRIGGERSLSSHLVHATSSEMRAIVEGLLREDVEGYSIEGAGVVERVISWIETDDQL